MRRGLVVYQLILILLAVAVLIWLIFMLVNDSADPIIAPADSALVDTAPTPVPSTPADTSLPIADTNP